jgi:hypothetical protein
MKEYTTNKVAPWAQCCLPAIAVGAIIGGIAATFYPNPNLGLYYNAHDASLMEWSADDLSGKAGYAGGNYYGGVFVH